MQAHEAQVITRTSAARGRGRLGTSIWTVGVAIGVVVALLLGAPTVGTAAGGHDEEDDHHDKDLAAATRVSQ
jgi:hypothetical protein